MDFSGRAREENGMVSFYAGFDPPSPFGLWRDESAFLKASARRVRLPQGYGATSPPSPRLRRDKSAFALGASVVAGAMPDPPSPRLRRTSNMAGQEVLDLTANPMIGTRRPTGKIFELGEAGVAGKPFSNILELPRLGSHFRANAME